VTTVLKNADTAGLEQELRLALEGEVRFDAYARAMYSSDAGIYSMEPIGVVTPRSVDDVAATMEIASRRGVPVLPRGAGTSQPGQSVNHAVVIDFPTHLHHILEVNPEERWVRTLPGISIDELNRQIRPHDLYFVPDPSTRSRANIGGAIGNNSCGARSIVYGKTVDHVLELDVVLSDGTRTRFGPLSGTSLNARMALNGLEGDIYRKVRALGLEHRDEVVRRFPDIDRRVGGYNLDLIGDPDAFDLTKIAVGSEGTLATITSAKLNLEPIPKNRGIAIIHFMDITEALEATVDVLEESPAAIEHAGSMVLRGARLTLGPNNKLDFLQGEPEEILIAEFFGDSEAEVAAKLDRLEQRMKGAGRGYAVTKTTNPAVQARVWAMRQAGQGLMANVPGEAKPIAFVEDTAVSPEKLPEFVRRFDEILLKHGTSAGYYGHVSVGCLHIRPVVNLKQRKGIEQMAGISEDIADLVIEFRGAISGEHGDGIARACWNEKAFGPTLYQAFRDVKAAFDPRGIMNPGKIIDAPPMTENLRYGEAYSTIPVATRLSFEEEGGFAAAVERCNGSGACHGVKAGTMCPSYMVTREEEHSTRARANALRAALSGLLPPEELQSERMFKVLDLCLSCKSCKAECPTHVDMTKLKAEFLHRYYQSHPVPLRSRLIADIHRLNAVAAPVAPLFNLAAGAMPVRWALDALVGIDRRRRLPRVRSRTFEKWFRSHTGPATSSRGQVVLFHDTFTNFNHPEAGIGAVALLEALGYEVVVVPHVCCGRPMISKGLLDKAAANARHNVDALFPHVERGLGIVGLEASCIATLKDEYPDLLAGDPRAAAVSKATLMLEELLVNTAGDGGPQLRFADMPRKVALHLHSHEQALIGAAPALNALRLPPAFEVTEIPPACCGLAGAFGYEKEHYELSMLIGEDRIFPSVRALPGDTEIIVTGVSCQEQIEHGTGRRPRFLAEVLAEALSR